MSDDTVQTGTAEDQGPVRVTEDIADQLAAKREDLFEEFELRDEFPSDVLVEARKRTEDVYDEIESELDERRDLRELTTWTTDPADA